MVTAETQRTIKSTGATFTPEALANYLAEKILSYSSFKSPSVLDPSCGEGELLKAIGNKLQERNLDFSLYGFDSNEEYINRTKDRLNHQPETHFVCADFLRHVRIPANIPNPDDLFSEPISHELHDIVIANPPYVRTQILGSDEAQRLAKKFRLKGRVDLYYPFLIGMTARLKENGVIGVITSNRYLSTKSGEEIRKFLSRNYEILEVIDLGDTKLFDAAVLPAIFIGRKKEVEFTPRNPAKFTKIYEDLEAYKGSYTVSANIYEVLDSMNEGRFMVGEKKYKKTSGFLVQNNVNPEAVWELLNHEESEWTAKIANAASFVIGDKFKVKVGIKTTADKVFIKKSWNEMGEDKPEESVLLDLISQENIERWNTTQRSQLQVLYPHYSEGGRKKNIDLNLYPKTKQYLEAHAETLKSRKYVIEAGREWFEIWVPHNPEHWRRPKLVFPDISNNPRFYFDSDGKLVNGNCYWISAEKMEDVNLLLLMQGVANSKLMTKYHDLMFNNKLYSGRRRYLTQYVEKYPIPNPESKYSLAIIETVKQLNNSSRLEPILKLEEELELLVAKSFGVAQS